MTGDTYLGFEGCWDLQVAEHGLNQQVDEMFNPQPWNASGNFLSVFGRDGGHRSGKQMKSCQVIISPKKMGFPLISLYGNIDIFLIGVSKSLYVFFSVS